MAEVKENIQPELLLRLEAMEKGFTELAAKNAELQKELDAQKKEKGSSVGEAKTFEIEMPTENFVYKGKSYKFLVPAFRISERQAQRFISANLTDEDADLIDILIEKYPDILKAV